MRSIQLLMCVVLAWGASPGSSHWSPGSSEPGQTKTAQVIFETDLGNFTVEIDLARAPVTAANFLKYVDGKFYDGGMANRAVRPDNTTRKDIEIQVVQFQSDPARGKELFPAIPLERTSVTGLKHLDGTISMARAGADTATSSFFICIGDQPSLDFGGKRNADGQGFAAFGRVVTGMDVVRKIHASKTRAPGGRGGAYGTETLEPVIRVVRAYRK
jgi:peptidyl-prolyl cis-trans isomerase A (cyclophilin A)